MAVLVVGLCALGVVMVLSASSISSLDVHHSPLYVFDRQVIWVGIGLAAMWVAARIDYHRWHRIAPWLLGGRRC